MVAQTLLAEVRLWGRLVGALAYDADTRISTFEYSPEWRASGVEIAPLRMPLAATKYQFPQLSYETYRGLPAVFADTLPDDFGNAVIDAWLARQGRDSGSFTAVERLLYTGTRGMGAMEFFPVIEPQYQVDDHLELASLVAMAQTVLDERAQLNKSVINGLIVDKDDAMQAIVQVGTSAGGARAKALIAVNADRSQIRSGQLNAPTGYEHYMLKFDGVEERRTDSETFGDPRGFGRLEYAYYLMAKDVGMDISDSELLLEGGRAHFMTRRFDRRGNDKFHYQSLCAMDHADFRNTGNYSYEQLLSVARRLRLPRSDAIEIFRRMVFNVIARNHDDHAKNFGFILDDMNGQWRLSPAFDVAYSYRKDSPWVNSHQMSINGKRDGFVRDDLMQVARLIGNFREAPSIINEVVAVVRQWPAYADKAGVFTELQQEVQSNLRLGGMHDW